MNATNITPEAPCSLCGGTTGSGTDGAHNLCRALADRGQPTPCLGERCPCCKGSGCHPRSAFGPINPNQDAVERWAPACRTCKGAGAVYVEAESYRRQIDREFARKRHVFDRCIVDESPKGRYFAALSNPATTVEDWRTIGAMLGDDSATFARTGWPETAAKRHALSLDAYRRAGAVS